MGKKNRQFNKQLTPENENGDALYVRAEEPAPVACEPEELKVDFDVWWAMRSARLPRQHHKEIIKADFKARGLGQCESLKAFDEALVKYGVKLS